MGYVPDLNSVHCWYSDGPTDEVAGSPRDRGVLEDLEGVGNFGDYGGAVWCDGEGVVELYGGTYYPQTLDCFDGGRESGFVGAEVCGPICFCRG